MAAVQNEIERLAPPPIDYVREAHPRKVDFFFQALAQCFFWGWIGSTLWAIWRGFDAQGSVHISEIFPRLGCAAACFLAWLLALSRA